MTRPDGRRAAVVERIDRDGDDVRVDPDDRAEERQLDPPEAGAPEDAAQGGGRLLELSPELPDGTENRIV